MRPFPGRPALALALVSTAVLGSILILAPDLVHATDKASPATPTASCSCPPTPAKTPEPTPSTPDTAKPWPRPKYADASPGFGITDETATLEAIHLALSELGDGASYVWHQRHGRLSGIINPTVSFKDAGGRVCRHVVMTLTAGPHSARTEGIACRMADKSWRLEG